MLNKRVKLSKEILVAISTFMATAFLFVSIGAWATTIGTNMDSSGTLGVATSTPWGTLAVDQESGGGARKPIFVVGDNGSTTPFVFVSQKGVVSFGTTTPSGLFLNPGDVVIGRNGATSDLFVSGGLGVANATTADGDFVIGTGPTFSVTSNGRLVLGASTTAATTGQGSVKLVVDGGDAIISSGGTGTTTLGVLNEAGVNGANGCIEMSSDGLLYRIMINGAGSDVLVEAGSCMGN